MASCDLLIEVKSLAQDYWQTGKVKYIHFRHKIAKTALKVSQGHRQWRNSVGHIPIHIATVHPFEDFITSLEYFLITVTLNSSSISLQQ